MSKIILYSGKPGTKPQIYDFKGNSKTILTYDIDNRKEANEAAEHLVDIIEETGVDLPGAHPLIVSCTDALMRYALWRSKKQARERSEKIRQRIVSAGIQIIR